MEDPAPTTRSTSPPTPTWLMSHKSSIWTIVATVEADVRVFCDTLGIESPIGLGASFGGMVALAYATRHPAHPSKLVLISTEAAGDTYLDRRVVLFERFGGPEVGALARRRFLDIDSQRDQASVDAWRKLAFPLYTRTPRDPNIGSRAV